jgi:hypothetical protein
VAWIENLKKAHIVLGIFLILCGCLVYCFWDSIRTEPFNSNVWKNRQNQRHYMYKNLEEHLVGKTETQVVTLLGPPARTNQMDWIYSMPAYKGDCWEFIVVFDKGRVIDTGEDRD